MPFEMLLLLLVWAATVGLIVVVPWVVVRLTVRVLEMDVRGTLERWLSVTPDSEQARRETTEVLLPDDPLRDGDQPTETVRPDHEGRRR
jgi:hypothetical protein